MKYLLGELKRLDIICWVGAKGEKSAGKME